MTIIEAVILGITEGITEFLPISSTAHLMMVSKIIGLEQTEFVKSFEIVIQGGAIAAIIFLYAKTLLQKRDLWKKIIVAFIPTGIIGLLLYQIIKSDLIGNFTIAMAGLIIGAWAILFAESKYEKSTVPKIDDPNNISYVQAVIIGIVQSLAVIPGVSRAAATIVPAMLLDVNRAAAVEFSFLLAIPTILAASGFDFIQTAETLNGNFLVLAVGFIVSFLSAILAVKLLVTFVKSNTLTFFAGYRILAAVLFMTIFL